MVSVLMPVFNSSDYLIESINSILRQTYVNFEFIIINDASVDDSEKIILSFLDNRIRYYKNERNLGVTATLNKGLGLCRGEYILRIDSDDVAVEDRLAIQVDFMNSNPHIGLCGSNIRLFGEKNEVVYYPEKHKDIVNEMFFSNPFAHPSVIIRKSVLDKHGLKYPEDYLAVEDYMFWIKLKDLTTLYNIQEVLLNYRIHKSQIKSYLSKEQQENITIIRENLFFQYFQVNSAMDRDIFRGILHHNYSKDIPLLIEKFSLFHSICVSDNNRRLTDFILVEWNRFIIFFPQYSIDNLRLICESNLFAKIPLKRIFIFIVKTLFTFKSNYV